MNSGEANLPRPIFVLFAAVLLLPPLAFGGEAVWRVQSPAVQRQLPVAFQPNVSPDGLVIVPLLNPERELLPGGRFRVWIGYRNGTPLANKQVTFRSRSSGNLLVADGSAVTEATVQTDGQGVAEVYVTPRPETGGNGGSDGGDGGGGDGGGGGPVPT